MKKGFTLLELIIVIVILGILATLGFTQYTRVVEKTRLSEAVTNFHTIRNNVISYYLQNGTITGMQNAHYGLGSDSASIPTSCVSTHYYYYSASLQTGDTRVLMYAHRCTSGGKAPNYSGTQYHSWAYFTPSAGRFTDAGCQEVLGSGNSTPWCAPFSR